MFDSDRQIDPNVPNDVRMELTNSMRYINVSSISVSRLNNTRCEFDKAILSHYVNTRCYHRGISARVYPENSDETDC